MRFSSLACLVLASTVAVDAFVPAAVVQKAKTSAASASTVSLSMAKKAVDDNDNDNDDSMPMWGKAVMASVVSWGMAAQLASAVMLPASSTSFQETSIMSSQPTTLISAKAKEETMDFNMPSYGETYKGDVTSSRFAPPSFNPFGDSSSKAPETGAASTSQVDDAAKQATDKADSDAKQAADKAAADAEKKAAKEQKKAEDKAARRLAEIEKQKQYAERSKAEESSKSAVPDIKAPAFDLKKPDMPEISIPALKAPDIKAPDMSKMSFGMPKIDMPKIEIPKLDMPKMDAPKMPKIEASSGGGYNLDVPASKAPEESKISMPKISMPKFDMPKISSPTGGYDLDIPAVKAPKGDMATFSLPALPNPFGGGGGGSKTADDTFVAPQEVRDESARQARGVYQGADQEAKDLEQKARELRDVANAKKQVANLAKDEACKTRPGGKILCIRNPFSAGF